MPSDTRRGRGRPRRWIGPRALAAYLVAALTVAPLLWLLVTVLKPQGEIFQAALPSRLTLDNLRYVLTEVPFGRYLLNSALVSVVVTVVALLFHSLAAYALARLHFPGRQLIFYGIVSTLLVSLPVILVFLANWNAFLWPLTATRDPNLRMVQVGIATLQGQYGSAWNYLLAATVIAAAPTVIAFLIGQRWLVEAIKTSGLK